VVLLEKTCDMLICIRVAWEEAGQVICQFGVGCDVSQDGS
jgi:hypothetical protein